MHKTHNKIAYNNRWNEERNRCSRRSGLHAVPERLDSLSTQHPEHYHERVPKVIEVPARYTVPAKLVRSVMLAKHFHTHQRKDVNHKTQD